MPTLNSNHLSRRLSSPTCQPSTYTIIRASPPSAVYVSRIRRTISVPPSSASGVRDAAWYIRLSKFKRSKWLARLSSLSSRSNWTQISLMVLRNRTCIYIRFAKQCLCLSMSYGEQGALRRLYWPLFRAKSSTLLLSFLLRPPIQCSVRTDQS